jgi:hypothetical protein
MLDAVAYRASETAAKRAIASWRLSNINDPYVFQNQGFPVRAESCVDLAQILDTMQEERFDHYMAEIGGFTDDETDQFVAACLDYVDFYQKVFQRERIVIPLSTMIAHFLIYKKLCGYNSRFCRLLELGPGCGYLSFFLRHHQSLRDYSQVESTESFYLLQSHINSHVFGSRFAEHAIPQQPFDDHNVYLPTLKWHTPFHYEDQKIVTIKKQAVCNHYPWWRLGDVADRSYDLVTSNANLNEFSREALFQYLSLLRHVLADDGAIIAQCLGGGAPSYDSVFANMREAGFVPVALVAGHDMPGRYFVVANAVFVGEGHPLYAKHAHSTPQFPTLDRRLEFVNTMYFVNEQRKADRRVRSASDILDMIINRLESTGTQQDLDDVPCLDDNGDRSDGDGRSSFGTAISTGSDTRHTPQRRSMSAGHLRRGHAQMHGDASVSSNRLELDRLRIAAELETTKRELAEIRSSTSWRLLAPFRSAVDATSRFRFGRSIRATARSLVRYLQS